MRPSSWIHCSASRAILVPGDADERRRVGEGRRQAEAPDRGSGSHHTGSSPLPVPALPPASPSHLPKRQVAEAPASPGSPFHPPPAPPLLPSALGGTSAFLSDLCHHLQILPL